MGAQNIRWIERLGHPSEVGPWRYLDKFQAGATQEIVAGQLLERTADTNTRWVPIDSDHDASAGAGLAIAGEDIKAGDLAGLYEILVPRPGDVFEFDLAAASALVPETALYYSASGSTYLTVTAGTYIIAYSVLGPNAPSKQKHLSAGQLGDSGETYRSTSRVRAVFRAACSIYKTIQKA
jgi:hypothetical protein